MTSFILFLHFREPNTLFLLLLQESIGYNNQTHRNFPGNFVRWALWTCGERWGCCCCIFPWLRQISGTVGESWIHRKVSCQQVTRPITILSTHFQKGFVAHSENPFLSRHVASASLFRRSDDCRFLLSWENARLGMIVTASIVRNNGPRPCDLIPIFYWGVSPSMQKIHLQLQTFFTERLVHLKTRLRKPIFIALWQSLPEQIMSQKPSVVWRAESFVRQWQTRFQNQTLKVQISTALAASKDTFRPQKLSKYFGNCAAPSCEKRKPRPLWTTLVSLYWT